MVTAVDIILLVEMVVLVVVEVLSTVAVEVETHQVFHQVKEIMVAQGNLAVKPEVVVELMEMVEVVLAELADLVEHLQ